MTTGQWNATMTEAQQAVTPPADLDKYMVVMGIASSGLTGLRGPYLTAAQAVADLAYGDVVDLIGQVCEQRQTNGTSVPSVPVSFYGLPATNAGTYGTLDHSGVTGTCVPAVGSSAPYGTYRGAVRIRTGGTVGTTGIEYETALDEIPTWSIPQRLGTNTSITIANSNVSFVLQPASASLTALYTKLTLLQTTMTGTGHFTITSGSPAVHLAADTTDDTALAAVAAATTPATAVALFNACKTYLGTHGASATYHTGADATLATALAAIPTAVNVADVDLYLDNLIAAYSAHIANTTGVHGSADGTNTITAYTSAPGTLNAGDIFFARTLGPYPATSDVDAAYTALSKSGRLFGIVAHEWPMTASMFAHLTTGLNTCQNTNRRMVALARTRVPDWETDEAESAWATAQETAFAVGTTDDSRIILWSSYEWETDARTTNVYLRAGFAQWCADVVRVPMNQPPCAPVDQPAAGVTLYTTDDTQVGHDEGPRGSVTGLSNADLGNRFVSTVSAADPLLGNATFYTVPWTMAGATDPIKTLMMRRIATSMERTAVSAAISQGGALLDYTAPDPNVPGSTYLLTDVSRNMLHAVLFNALSDRYAPFIQNADDADLETGLVYINPAITVSAGKLVSVEYKLNVRFQGVLVSLAGTFKVQE
jgi:hypothetical protein